MDERCHNDLNKSSPYDSGPGELYYSTCIFKILKGMTFAKHIFFQTATNYLCCDVVCSGLSLVAGNRLL